MSDEETVQVQLRALAKFISRALTELAPADPGERRKYRARLSQSMFDDIRLATGDNFQAKAGLDLLMIAQPEDRD